MIYFKKKGQIIIGALYWAAPIYSRYTRGLGPRYLKVILLTPAVDKWVQVWYINLYRYIFFSGVKMALTVFDQYYKKLILPTNCATHPIM